MRDAFVLDPPEYARRVEVPGGERGGPVGHSEQGPTATTDVEEREDGHVARIVAHIPVDGGEQGLEVRVGALHALGVTCRA